MDPILLDAAMPDGELKDKLTAYGILDVGQLAQQYADTRHAYDSSIRAPGDGATAEELASFHRKMGAADSVEGYGIPEGMGQSQLGQTLEAMRAIAHTKGMPVDTWDAFTAQAQVATRTVAEERAAKLASVTEGWQNKSREQFGDKYEATKALGQRIVNELSTDPEVKILFEKTGLAHHPKMLEAFAKVAAITSPESTPAGLEGTTVKEPLEQARDLRVDIMEIMTSDEYKDKSHARHEVSMRKFYGKQRELAKLGFEGATDPRLQPVYLAP